MASSPSSPTALTHNANAFVTHVSSMVPNQLAPGSQLPQQFFTTEASRRAWQAHLQTLSPEAQALFQRWATGSVEEYTKYVFETSKKHKKGSRLLKVNALFRPFFQTLNMYAPIVASAAQADPYPSSLVIGGVMCVLKISENLADYQELLSKWLSKLTTKISVLMDFEIYIYQQDVRVQEVLVKIYADILHFCQKALNLYKDEQDNRRGGFKMFSKSLKERFSDNFGAIIETFESHLEEYRGVADLCDGQRLRQSYMLQVDEALRQRQFRQELRQFSQAQQLLNEEQRRHHEDERLLGREIRQHHHDQLAFRDASHQAYDTILMSISDSKSAAQTAEVQRRLELDRVRLEEAKRRRDEKRKCVIDWLPSVAFKDEHDRRCKIREKGTGLWLLQNGIYKSWKASANSSLLWVKGKAGCGKSVLSASTLSELQEDTRAPDAAVAYFYCMSNDQSTSSTSMLLSTIVKQLCSQYKGIEPELESLFDKNSLAENKGPRDSDLVRILPLVSSRFSEVFVLIDGLDECDEPKLIMEPLQSLINNATLRVKVVFFSRPGYVSIENALKDSLQLRVDRGANTDDITAFIASKLSTDEFDWNVDQKLLETVKAKMLDLSENMFLYVNLQAGTLKGPLTQSQVLDRLAALPKGLDNTYKAALKRVIDNEDVEQRDLALRILIWVANAKTPLSRAELLEALSIRAGLQRLDKNEIIPTDRQFITMCADLVEVDNENRYNLIHSSLREYLANLRLDHSLELTEYRAKQIVAESTLCEACLTYLLFDQFKSGPATSRKEMRKLKKENPFLEYAAKNWGHHIPTITDDTPVQLVWNLLEAKTSRSLTLQILLMDDADFKNEVFPFPDNTPSALHGLACFGLASVAALRPEQLNESLHQKDGFGCIPLDYALLLNKGRDMCMWLLCAQSKPELVQPPPMGRYSPLHMAAEYQWTDVFDRLISSGYNLNVYMTSNRQTPLAFAALKGHLWAVEKLLTAEANVEARADDKATPLILAAEGNHIGILSALLAAEANVDAQNNIGATALHYATSCGNVQAVNMLLDHGAAIKHTNSVKDYDRAPTHLAARKNPPDMIKALHSWGADLNVKSGTGYTPIHMAIGNKALETAQELIDLGVELDAVTDEKETLLHIAAMYSDEECVKFVLDAIPGFIEAREALGDTALNIAAFKGSASACEALLQHGAVIDVPNKSNLTALLQAIDGSHLEASKILLRHKADPRLADSIGSPALLYAAKRNLSELVPLLIDAGADPNARNDNNDTALYSACRQGSIEFVQQLFVTVPGLDPHHRCQYGKTPLHAACEGGHLEAARILVSKGIQCITDDDNNLPLHRAAACGHDEIVKLLLAHMDIDSRGYWGQTSLKMAAACGHEQTVNTLLDAGASIDCADDNGSTPLLTAVQTRHVAVADLLMNRGANLQAKTNTGYSIVHAAAQTGHSTLLSKLIELGCDGRVATSFGATPFLLAVESGSFETFNLLLSRGVDGSKDKTNDGATCVHHAVGAGNWQIFEKLLELQVEYTLADAHGRTPLFEAAWKGRYDYVEWLLLLGAPVDGAEAACCRSPLSEASRKGFLYIVAKLLEHNADVEKRQVHSRMTALMEAALSRRPETVRLLVAMGADPFKRDACGNSALDYAYRHPATFEAMGRARFAYQALDDAVRKKLARASACALLQKVLDIGPLTSLPVQVARLVQLSVLSSLLLHMDAEASKPIIFELIFLPNKDNVSISYSCDLCHKRASGIELWACKTCFDTELCPACYKNYLAGSKQEPKCCPEAIAELEELEAHVSIYLQNYDIEKRNLAWDLSFITSRSAFLTEEWVNEKLAKYKEWEEKHADTSYVVARRRTAQEVLKMCAESIALFKAEADDAELDADDEAGDSLSISARKAALEKKAADFLRDTPFQDINTFDCAGHDYLCISKADWETAKADRSIFDADGRLCDAWLRELLAKYKDDDEDGGPGAVALDHYQPYRDPSERYLSDFGSDLDDAEWASEGLGLPVTDGDSRRDAGPVRRCVIDEEVHYAAR